MTNITLSAKEEQIQMLRQVARSENKSANDLFREWLDTVIAEKRMQKKREWLENFNKYRDRLSIDLSDGMPDREERNRR